MSRALLWFLLLAPALAAATSVPSEREWRFRVLLGDNEVGTHVFRVEERDGERHVRSDAQFTVRFLFFDAYQYIHQAREHWRGNCLQTLESKTDDNGKQLMVRGQRNGRQFDVIASERHESLPACVMSFAYWNPAILEQPQLLNVQTGELTPVRVEPLGRETLLVDGAPQVAGRYALHAPRFRIDVWYADDSQWVQLESRTGNGRLLRYLIQ